MKRIGIGFLGENDFKTLLECVKIAESKGYESVWIAEHYLLRDSFCLLASLAMKTKKIKLATGIVSPYTRNIALLAMSISTLDEISNGRAILGLGSHLRYWNQLGIYDKTPLLTMKKTIECIRKLLLREKISSYKVYQTNLKGIELNFNPYRKKIPIYIGAIGPKMLQLAGEIADGVLLSAMCSPSYVKYAIENIKVGVEKAGREMDEIDIASYIVVWNEKEKDTELLIKKWLAAFLSAPGREKMLDKEVYEEANLKLIRKFIHEGDLLKATNYVTREMLSSVTAFGNFKACKSRINEYIKAGVKLPIILPIGLKMKDLIKNYV